MPTRTRQQNKRRPVRKEIEITPTASGIPEQWQQPSAPRQTGARGSPAGQRPAEPSQWQQSPGSRQQASPASPAQEGAGRRRRKRRPPLSTVLFPQRAQRIRSRRRRHAAPDSRAERQKQRLKRQRRYLLFHRLLTLALILGMGILALTLFFKVETVSIVGHSRYTDAQLLETAAIEKGDNLFLLSRRTVRNRLFDEYPYLDTVRVEQKPPNQVIIHVVDAVPAAAVGSGTTYYYMDASGKLLEQVSMDRLGEIPVVTGVTVDDVEVGKWLNMRRDDRLRQLTVLLTLLEEQELMSRVDFINLSDMENVRIGCDGHMYIRFGTMEQLERKMRFAKKFVEETSPSLFCEIEVSGEILWEGHPSYRVIPVSEEEVVMQSRDLDAAVDENGEPVEPGADPNAAATPTAPVLPGSPAAGDGEEGGEEPVSSGTPEDAEEEEEDGGDADAPAGSFPAAFFPSGSSSGNWRAGM